MLFGARKQKRGRIYFQRKGADLFLPVGASINKSVPFFHERVEIHLEKVDLIRHIRSIDAHSRCQDGLLGSALHLLGSVKVGQMVLRFVNG